MKNDKQALNKSADLSRLVQAVALITVSQWAPWGRLFHTESFSHSRCSVYTFHVDGSHRLDPDLLWVVSDPPSQHAAGQECGYFGPQPNQLCAEPCWPVLLFNLGDDAVSADGEPSSWCRLGLFVLLWYQEVTFQRLARVKASFFYIRVSVCRPNKRPGFDKDNLLLPRLRIIISIGWMFH